MFLGEDLWQRCMVDNAGCCGVDSADVSGKSSSFRFFFFWPIHKKKKKNVVNIRREASGLKSSLTSNLSKVYLSWLWVDWNVFFV